MNNKTYELDFKMCYPSIMQIISKKKNKISIENLSKLYFQNFGDDLKKKHKQNLYGICLQYNKNCYKRNELLKKILLELKEYSDLKYKENIVLELKTILYKIQCLNLNELKKKYKNKIDFIVFADQIVISNYKIINDVRNIMIKNSFKVLKEYNNNIFRGLIVNIKKTDYTFDDRKKLGLQECTK